MIRSGLRRLLEDHDDIDVRDTCRREAVVESVEKHRPNVVLLGDEPSREETLARLAALRRTGKRPRVALLTRAADERFATDALLAGADGLLRPDISEGNLVHALRVLCAGSSVVPPAAFRDLLARLSATNLPAEVRSRAATLTTRERGVLALLVQGMSNIEMSRELRLSRATVKEHISNIYAKLGTTNRVQAAVLAHRMGLGHGAESTQHSSASPQHQALGA
ncbi:LuxR C-terminal-related transcriptional regulator [Streptomyces sp. NPDC093568]|uniref:LuxR C-terminal-related transcriptional regulator n=1 Tax=Streptomyces sp. NPDC093568 TaxID=3366041 RepID=UPI00382D5B5E